MNDKHRTNDSDISVYTSIINNYKNNIKRYTFPISRFAAEQASPNANPIAY